MYSTPVAEYDGRPLHELRETLIVKEAIRRTMQGNRGKESKPEIALRCALWKVGLRGYRKNVKKLPGKPDIVFGRAELAIFVHGCFWHGCTKCKRRYRTPKTNPRYWTAKIEGNQVRDERNRVLLVEMGYDVLVFWECEIKGDGLNAAVEKVRVTLAGR